MPDSRSSLAVPPVENKSDAETGKLAREVDKPGLVRDAKNGRVGRCGRTGASGHEGSDMPEASTEDSISNLSWIVGFYVDIEPLPG